MNDHYVSSQASENLLSTLFDGIRNPVHEGRIAFSFFSYMHCDLNALDRKNIYYCEYNINDQQSMYPAEHGVYSHTYGKPERQLPALLELFFLGFSLMLLFLITQAHKRRNVLKKR